MQVVGHLEARAEDDHVRGDLDALLGRDRMPLGRLDRVRVDEGEFGIVGRGCVLEKVDDAALRDRESALAA